MQLHKKISILHENVYTYTTSFTRHVREYNTILTYRCMGMELKRNYDTPEFHEDLRKMYLRAGLHVEDTVFLFTDTQITKEEFLEDINNMLNSGKF